MVSQILFDSTYMRYLLKSDSKDQKVLCYSMKYICRGALCLTLCDKHILFQVLSTVGYYKVLNLALCAMQ